MGQHVDVKRDTGCNLCSNVKQYYVCTASSQITQMTEIGSMVIVYPMHIRLVLVMDNVMMVQQIKCNNTKTK